MMKRIISMGAIFAAAAFAQTNGTVTITGTVPTAISLTHTDNGIVSSTIALGTLNPANDNNLTTGTTGLRIRTNKAYKLEARAVLTRGTSGSDDGGDKISLADIGFGVTALDATGVNVANDSHTIATGYDVSTGWPAAANGLTPAFTKTLGDLTTSTQILSGPRISKKGNIATDNNFVLCTLGVATLPQYFTPEAGFSIAVQLTVSNP
jgi:hypothetical protein